MTCKVHTGQNIFSKMRILGIQNKLFSRKNWYTYILGFFESQIVTAFWIKFITVCNCISRYIERRVEFAAVAVFLASNRKLYYYLVNYLQLFYLFTRGCLENKFTHSRSRLFFYPNRFYVEIEMGKIESNISPKKAIHIY